MYEGLTGAVVDPVTGEQPPGHAAGGPRRRAAPAPRAAIALFDRVLEPDRAPLRPRRGTRAISSTGVAAYELMNEPDFVIDEWEADLQPARAAAAAVRDRWRS